jgi:ProP effector
MSSGRDKLDSFSLLKSLTGKKNIRRKIDHIKAVCTKTKSWALGIQEPKRKVYDHNTELPHDKQGQKKTHVRVTKKDYTSQQATALRMPQFGQRQGKKLIVGKLELPAMVVEESAVVNINIGKTLFREGDRIFRWLCQRFPKCFNPQDKRPLKVGISKDIEEIYKNEHLSLINNSVLSNVLRRYVGDKKYQHSVLKYKVRFNLEGIIVEKYQKDHILFAEQRLKELTEKSSLKSSSPDIEEKIKSEEVINKLKPDMLLSNVKISKDGTTSAGNK